jgi:hypothetical protein
MVTAHGLQGRFGQRFERDNGEHQALPIVNNAPYHQGGNGARPEGFPLGLQVLERLAELRIEVQAGIDLSDGLQYLATETASGRRARSSFNSLRTFAE